MAKLVFKKLITLVNQKKFSIEKKTRDGRIRERREKRVERWFGVERGRRILCLYGVDKCYNCFCASVWRLVLRR